VNDTFGHARRSGAGAGGGIAEAIVACRRFDRTLRRRRVRDAARRCGHRRGESIVARTQTTIESWFRDRRFRCGISIGFAAASTVDWDLEQVLHSVDRLLYQSKALRNSGDANPADELRVKNENTAKGTLFSSR